MSRIDHPPHYNQHPSGIECIDIVEHYNFNIGNAMKYLWRAGLKSSDLTEDLRKAEWYIQREIERVSQTTTSQEREGPSQAGPPETSQESSLLGEMG